MRNIKDLMNLKGRTALITGATGGIGQAAAITIAELGGDLLLVDRPRSDYALIKQRILEKHNVNIEQMDCDLENEESRQYLIDKVNGYDKDLNIIINNAAFVGESDLKGWITDFEDQDIDTWRRALEVNLTAIFHLSKGLAKKLKNSKNQKDW